MEWNGGINKWPKIHRQLRWFHPEISGVLGLLLFAGFFGAHFAPSKLHLLDHWGRPHTATNRGGMAAVASWGWVWGPNPPGNTTNWSPAGLKAATVSFHGTFFFDSQMTQRKVHEMLVGSKRGLDFIEIFDGFIQHPHIVWLGSLSSSQKTPLKMQNITFNQSKSHHLMRLCHPQSCCDSQSNQGFFRWHRRLGVTPQVDKSFRNYVWDMVAKTFLLRKKLVGLLFSLWEKKLDVHHYHVKAYDEKKTLNIFEPQKSHLLSIVLAVE